MVGEEGGCNTRSLLFINNLKTKTMTLQNLILIIITGFLLIGVYMDNYASKRYMQGSYAYYMIFIALITSFCLLTYLWLMFITIK